MKIQYLVMDVDGTLTDGKIYMGENGEVCKAFNIKDGYGIHDMLIPAGIMPVIITGRKSKILMNRCKELGITEVYQGISDKINQLSTILQDNHSSYGNVAYIGDDENDLGCMQKIKDAGGMVGCPSDAVPKVKDCSDFISTCTGGNGAVREFIEWILKKQ